MAEVRKIGCTKIVIRDDCVQPEKTEEILDNISRIISEFSKVNLTNNQDIA